MPGLVPGIHVLVSALKKDVDGRAFAAPKRLRPRRRDKPGHDDAETYAIAFPRRRERPSGAPNLRVPQAKTAGFDAVKILLW
jgi:hypothetical protein